MPASGIYKVSTCDYIRFVCRCACTCIFGSEREADSLSALRSRPHTALDYRPYRNAASPGSRWKGWRSTAVKAPSHLHSWYPARRLTRAFRTYAKLLYPNPTFSPCPPTTRLSPSSTKETIEVSLAVRPAGEGLGEWGGGGTGP